LRPKYSKYLPPEGAFPGLQEDMMEKYVKISIL
jgi:hypothetical protein